MKFKVLALSALLALPLTANAQVAYEMNDLKSGEVLMNLDATERTEVSEDTLIARLEYVVTGKDRNFVQNEINKKMKDVVDEAEDEDTVEFSTENYHVYMMHDPRPMDSREKPVIEKWRGQQQVMLKSTDSEALLELAGELQGMNLTMINLSYMLSPEQYEKVSDSLMEAALKKLQARANAAAKALGKSSAELIRVDLGSNGNVSRPPMMMSMARAESMEADMKAPSAKPGMSEVSMSVSATALLKP